VRIELDSGAEARLTGEVGERAVVCVNGGKGAEAPGTWSASVEYLVRALAPASPSLAFVEVRYRVKSWRRLDECVEDGRAAIAAARERGARQLALVGFSMGAAVSVRIAYEPEVTTVIGLAPWLPPQLDLAPLAGRRLAVVHGALDAPLPGIPGVKPSVSADAHRRALALGVESERTVIGPAIHAIALRARSGRLVPMPGARRWVGLVLAELERFCA